MIEQETKNDYNGKNFKQKTTSTKNLKRQNCADSIQSSVTKQVKLNANENVIKTKVKAPTLEEINELKETRNLFHSNLFRLQIKEMLNEVKLKESYKVYMNEFLEKLKQFLHNLPAMTEKIPLNSSCWLKNVSDVKVPFDLSNLKVGKQLSEKVASFKFIKPTLDPFFIGAASTHTLLGPKIYADICIVMPSQYFQKDNYLNLVYDEKRALYLTYLVHAIIKCNKEFSDINAENLQFTYMHNNPFKSILEIIPPQAAGSKLCKHFRLRILLSCAEDTFKLNRFVPWNNNIRLSMFDEYANDEMVQPATPMYNANILFDMTMQGNYKILHEIFDSHPNFQDALILLKIWLRQRDLNVGFNGIQSHIMAMFIVYLFHQRKLYHNMSSYQVVRNVWNQLAFSKWHESNGGICLCPLAKVQPNQPTLEQMHTYYDIVFVDITGFHNICSNLSVDIYKRLCFEAKVAIDILNDINVNSFQLLFMTKVPLYTQFDHILKIYRPEAVEQILEIHVTPSDKCNYGGHTYTLLLKVISGLLRKGLKDRVKFLLPFEDNITSWPVTETPSSSDIQHVYLGFILDDQKAFEIMDKGPESIDERATEFRQFWGDKAQLRRFQDGSITESVVWASNNDCLAKKRLIPRAIVLHLLQHHFQLESKYIDYIAGEFDITYRLNKSFKVENITNKYSNNIQQDTDAEFMALKVIREFDDVSRKLSELKELPLEIVSITGISPVLRYCEPQPNLPIARCVHDQFHAINVQYGIIQLGHSGKWPDELTALRALKTAFYIQIAKLLQQKYKILSKVTYDGIMVLHHGYCFNFEIAHSKEVGLLKREQSLKGIIQYVDCPDSIALEKRHYILPKVAGTLKALHHQYPSYGSAVMIAKRWLYSQLIDNALWPDECTELLIAAQYLKAKSQYVTCSPQTGFWQFLHLLSNTDWKSELCLLNFNNTMTDIEITELEQKFHNERDSFPNLCIVTSCDLKHYGQIWTTMEKPDIHVLARVILLARHTLSNIFMSLQAPAPFLKISKLFMAPSEGYDLIIQIKPENVPNTLAFEFGSPFVTYTKPNFRLPLAQTNFMKTAVQQLRAAYSEVAAFFYNPCGGKEIGIVWKPHHIFEKKPFKVNDLNACSLMENAISGHYVQIKKETLIEDFKFILKDFYMQIDTVANVKLASFQAVKKTKASFNGIFEKPRKQANSSQRYFNCNSNKATTKVRAKGIKLKK